MAAKMDYEVVCLTAHIFTAILMNDSEEVAHTFSAVPSGINWRCWCVTLLIG